MVDADEAPTPIPQEFTLDKFYVRPTQTLTLEQYVIEYVAENGAQVAVLAFDNEKEALAVRKELNKAYRLGISAAISYLLQDVEASRKLQLHHDMDKTNANRTKRHP